MKKSKYDSPFPIRNDPSIGKIDSIACGKILVDNLMKYSDFDFQGFADGLLAKCAKIHGREYAYSQDCLDGEDVASIKVNGRGRRRIQ